MLRRRTVYSADESGPGKPGSGATCGTLQTQCRLHTVETLGKLPTARNVPFSTGSIMRTVWYRKDREFSISFIRHRHVAFSHVQKMEQRVELNHCGHRYLRLNPSRCSCCVLNKTVMRQADGPVMTFAHLAKSQAKAKDTESQPATWPSFVRVQRDPETFV